MRRTKVDESCALRNGVPLIRSEIGKDYHCIELMVGRTEADCRCEKSEACGSGSVEDALRNRLPLRSRPEARSIDSLLCSSRSNRDASSSNGGAALAPLFRLTKRHREQRRNIFRFRETPKGENSLSVKDDESCLNLQREPFHLPANKRGNEKFSLCSLWSVVRYSNPIQLLFELFAGCQLFHERCRYWLMPAISRLLMSSVREKRMMY